MHVKLTGVNEFYNKAMSKLQILNVFLTDRLTLAAQEIFKAVEDIFSEYNEEICRSRKEIELLRRRLQQAGLQIDSGTQSCSNETRDTQTLSDERWRCEEDRKDTEVQIKLEVYTEEEEDEVQTSVCNESTTLSPFIDTNHDQMASKDIENQILDSSENDFPFIYQYAQIKNEPGLHTEAGSTCQSQHFTRHGSDDPWTSHIDSAAHMTQVFNLPFRNQEMLMQQRMELAQIHLSQSSVCQDEGSKSDKRKATSTRYYHAWRDRLKKDPVKFAEFKASEAARLREYRRRKSAAAIEIDRKSDCERQTIKSQKEVTTV
ncbi:uncharacterized protein [Misgurnus anguillicaudatus]|uniref:uncharacterized protein isoform X2 n=1 Tax=Misgurnus anguillicaudatus TaxID=75329 RepID=UPI003CCF0E13